MKYSLVIFDLDGTLLDTIADLAAATNHALQKNGFLMHDVETLRTFVGNGIGKLLERALPEEGRTADNVERLRSDFVPYYDGHNADLSQPYPGVAELLSRLQQKGAMLAVASNKYQEAAQQLVDHFFPNIFHFVYGKREGLAAKPDPMVVRHCIIQALKAYRHIDQVALFGDSYIDIQTAHNANITAVGCTWGYGEESKLLAAKPHHILHSPQQIYNLCYEL